MGVADEKLDQALSLHQSGQLEEAAKLYQEVLRASPDNADAVYLFGCLAHQSGNHAAARDLLQRATRLAPDQAEYHHVLGLALNALEDYKSAVPHFQRALVLAPQHPHARTALAHAWYGQGCAENLRYEFASAQHCFAEALKLQPEWLEARHNLGRALYELGHVSEAFQHFSICAATNHPGSEHSRAMMAVIVPGVPEAGNEEILKTRQNWATCDLPRDTATRPRSIRRTPLRVAYVSSFFHRDNWMKPVWGLINKHDRSKVHVHLFSDCAQSAIQHGYRPGPDDRYFDTSQLSNAQIADLAAQTGIDILVDLNGYSNMKRLPLFAQKVAPVTIGWFNMYATTGMSTFDYLIGDSEVVKPEEEHFYSEKVLRVPGSYLTFNVNYPVPPVTQRVQKGEIVFGSLASQYKITDQVIGTWSRILLACPGSSLLLKNKQMASANTQVHLQARFAQYGVPQGRLQLEGPEPHFDFLKAYDRIDIALDTFPYNGGTTTTEAIWQGVPVITYDGDRWASRTSASILRAANLGRYVATDLDGYVNLAISLATASRPDRLHMRDHLSASSVCNTSAFARHMEELFIRAL